MRRPDDAGIYMNNDGVLPEIEYESLEFYECLSSGTYGTVYRAKWNPGGQIVAVKRLLVLEKEAHILSLLRHRNIIQFFGAVTKPPNFCIVTEFSSNGSLYGYLHDKRNLDLSFDSIVQWALDIASGIHYLHFEAPVAVVHRDLKSKNVVISANDVCKLCDFGTSRALVHTTRMSYVGTMAWMSPEMIQSMPVSEATDTWSYGVILWELITREIPFDKLDTFRIAWMVVENGVRLTVPTSCPEPFSDLLKRCWETDSKLRPDFREILTRLKEIRRDDSTSTKTREFLGKKNEWKKEILEETERLKEKESELNDKQTKLREWEQRLRKREQNLEYNRRRELPSHDVNIWTEEDVVTWLLKLHFNGVTYQQLTELATIFRNQQITGERLLLLTETDLGNMGVSSPAFQWQLLREITRLNYDNRRLINFPPLSNQQNDTQTATTITTSTKEEKPRRGSPSTSSIQQRSVHLTLLFGMYIRPGPGVDSHKWKMLMDIEDDHDFLADHPTISEFEQLIAEVRFMVPTPPYMYKANRFPYVMQEWIIGLNGATRVHCVVNFTDNVRQPRNTNLSFDVDFERRGLLVEKRVQLFLRYSLATPRSSGIGPSGGVSSIISSVASSGVATLRNFLTPNTGTRGLRPSQSSPGLARAWKDRSFPDAVPVVAPPATPPQKSPLWSQIVRGLTESPLATSSNNLPPAKKKTSAPGPPVETDDRTPLSARAISHDPRHVRLRSLGAGSLSRSSVGSDIMAGTMPKSTQQSISYSGVPSEKLIVERAQSLDLPTTPGTPRRRGGQVRHPRKSRGSNSFSVGTSETTGSSSNSSTTPVHSNELASDVRDGSIDEIEDSAETDVGLGKQQAQENSSSVMSVQVHGGYQKWKWKHRP